MSSHAATKIDQKEYLKKYLSGDKVKKKKKDKKRKREIGAARVKIIDDDATYKQTQEEFNEDLLLGGEDAPQIVGEYIADTVSSSNVPKWRSIVVKDEPDDNGEIKVKREPEEDLWGQKQNKGNVKDNSSPPRRNAIKEMRKISPDKSLRMSKCNGNSQAHSSSGEERRNGRSVRRNNFSPEHSGRRRNEQSSYKSARTPDLSPARIMKRKSDRSSPSKANRSPDQSPPRRNNKEDSDESPPRKIDRSYHQSPKRRSKRTPEHSTSRRDNRTPDQSPPRKTQNYSARKERSPYLDQSPPRKAYRSPNRQINNSKHKSAQSQNKPSTQKLSNRSSSSDQSPPMKTKHESIKSTRSRSASADQSPQRRKKRDASPDQSPPRYRSSKEFRKRSRSPGKKKRIQSSDYSPPRRYENKRSPTRKHKYNESPIRIKREKISPDQSPPRRRQAIVKKERTPSPPPSHSRWSKLDLRSSDSPPPTHKPKASKTLDGKKAGLQDAKSLKEETDERRRREERMYNEMSKEVSGRDAEVRVRTTGRKGKRARDAEAEDPEERRRKEEHERKKKEKYDRWGKGLKQVEEHRQRTEAESYEGSKPLARYENDKDLDRHLREQERADDPMLEYMRKKKKERQKETGNIAEIPKYEGSYPENRFGIRPGYRWDGVDRSNGFEKKWFDVQNEKRAQQEEAYLYSVEDM